MKRLRLQAQRRLGVLGIVGCLLFLTPTTLAAPFGHGVFGADVPFGSATSISINLGDDVALSMNPDGGNFRGTGSHTVTVTSHDVVGYYLYAHTTGSNDMISESATIPASNNSVAAPLNVGTWGFNTTGSTTDFLGMSTTSSLIKDAPGPYKNGDSTSVTYGALVSNIQPAGHYSVAVTYTTVAKNQ